MLYDIVTVNDFLRNTDIYETLQDYCQLMGNKYAETNEGRYRIKYNSLNTFLYKHLSDEKKVEFFNSFATSLDIYPIIRIKLNSIQLKMI